MEEEKKAAVGVDWAEKAPAAPRRRSRKKSAAKGISGIGSREQRTG